MDASDKVSKLEQKLQGDLKKFLQRWVGLAEDRISNALQDPELANYLKMEYGVSTPREVLQMMIEGLKFDDIYDYEMTSVFDEG